MFPHKLLFVLILMVRGHAKGIVMVMRRVLKRAGISERERECKRERERERRERGRGRGRARGEDEGEEDGEELHCTNV